MFTSSSPREYIKRLLPFVSAFALLPAFITRKERKPHEGKAHTKQSSALKLICAQVLAMRRQLVPLGKKGKRL